ncbi:thiamine monophosphate synthase [Methylobacterium sp. Leaf104]|uniref:thiamine phosphate synthase n=1 Tax=Methylobacterium TaxID=407 RepID=UPI0006F2199E|nr:MULTISPECIES: thiamine phosphate synthase [Methylobacterium]KQP42805.1 thiamine monophosphate synthase [Methylobacterium sp. Leaf104]MCI9878610.1 thiamine phosphate synthase [Methylobacterium goesingense]
MSELPSRLLVVTDRSATDSPDVAARLLHDTLARLLRAGARWIWFRERDLAPEARRALARDVVRLVKAGGGALTIGADVALAAELGADGVHLPGGTNAAELAKARRRLPDGWIGVSAHAPDEVAMAARAGADYATLSPIFPTPSKPGYGPALGPEAIRIATGFGMPVIALGGITVDRVEACRSAGAAGVAVMGALMRPPDPTAAARAYLARLAAGSGERR